MDFVFFFKQKTAYEMRISDWSSDVCSSDLAAVGKAFAARDERAVGKASRAIHEQMRDRWPERRQVVAGRDQHRTVAAKFETATIRLEGEGGIVHHHPMRCARRAIKPLRAIS